MARGGRRNGAGRPAGSNWKPKVSALRSETVKKMTAIVTGDDDPLTTVANWVTDPTLDKEFRLSAAAVALPYLYPRLSASSVDARMTVAKVDSTDLLRRLDERLSRLAQPPIIEVQPETPPLAIEAAPEEEDE